MILRFDFRRDGPAGHDRERQGMYGDVRVHAMTRHLYTTSLPFQDPDLLHITSMSDLAQAQYPLGT